ncbi:hypothetical protein, partial [Amycolatopsis solani]|uniref:hypothetical protein n=1 Tax=Amycolatopsis solani TaxID=3028615 RepID=UPI0025B15511
AVQRGEQVPARLRGRGRARPPRHLTTHERAYLDAGTAAEARARRARHGRHLVVLAAVLVLAAPGPPGGGQAGCGPSAVVLSGPLSAAAPVPAPDNAER